MSQLTIQLSDKADALLAQLQKEIFQRRRKKVSPEGVIETLVESGAKSQSDKRFATSWKNLVSDIEKAARLADAHGTKPAVLSDAEWALVLTHRSRSAATSPTVTPRTRKKTAGAAKPAGLRTAERKQSSGAKTATRGKTAPATGRTTPATGGSKRVRSSVAKRMATAVNRLDSSAVATPTATSLQDAPAGNGAAVAETLLS
jgi:hypothetical protein